MINKLKEKKGVALAVTSILMIWVFLVLSTLVNYTINNSNKIKNYALTLNYKIEVDQIGTDFVNISDFKNYYILEFNFTQDFENENLIFNNKYKLIINNDNNTLMINNKSDINLLTVALKKEGENWVIKGWKYNPSVI